jgi:hypothetical protein
MLRLKARSDGTGTIVLKARGTPLGLPSLPPAPPLTVQLQRRDGAGCWSATFSVPATSTSDRFKARAD